MYKKNKKYAEENENMKKKKSKIYITFLIINKNLKKK
jgi:hypothetical protein